MRRFTTEETIQRVWETEEIKKVMARRANFIANEERARELDELWVSDPAYTQTASFGRNTGFYVGMDAIRGYYVDKHAAELGDGTGWLSSHPLTTPLIYIAGDGKTARGLWYSIAQETRPNGDGSALALWMPEKIGADFVRQDDGWRIWHIMIANDLVCEAGANYEKDPVYIDFETDPVVTEFGEPTIRALVHDQTFNWWDDYPPQPKPYAAWSDDESYGPEGWRAPETRHLRAKEGKNYR